jgi:hypothetical protein
MHKSVFFGILALALLALPMAVAAADSAQTQITGSVDTSLSVTVDDAALSLGAMDVGNNPQAAPHYLTTKVHVTASGPITGWAVTAKDQGTIKTGWLLSGSDNLENPLEFGWGSLPVTDPWPSDLKVQRTINTDTTYPFDPTATDVFFRQKVVAGDPVGSYTMVVQFNVVLA